MFAIYGSIISQHNKKILRCEPTPLRCRRLEKSNCPMPGKCATDKVVYRATVETAEKDRDICGNDNELV